MGRNIATKWDSFFVTKWDGTYHKVGQVLQSETDVVTKWDRCYKVKRMLLQSGTKWVLTVRLKRPLHLKLSWQFFEQGNAIPFTLQKLKQLSKQFASNFIDGVYIEVKFTRWHSKELVWCRDTQTMNVEEIICVAPTLMAVAMSNKRLMLLLPFLFYFFSLLEHERNFAFYLLRTIVNILYSISTFCHNRIHGRAKISTQ